MALFKVDSTAILRMVKFKKATTLGISSLLIKVPGTPGTEEGRYIEGGEGWFENQHLDDFFCVCITDEDNILGYGAGTVIGSYTETEITTAEEGWYIPVGDKKVTVTALAGFGWIPAGLYLKVDATKGDLTADTFRMNVKWGIKDVG